MRVGVVLAGAVVVVVIGIGVERGELFEPDAEVAVQAALVDASTESSDNQR
jgi:hypothetical protein